MSPDDPTTRVNATMVTGGSAIPETLASWMAEDGQKPMVSVDVAQGSLAALVKRLAGFYKELDIALKNVAEIEKDIKQVEERDIPAMMTAAGVSELRLTDGTFVEVGTEYYASITEERKPAAFAWLRETGNEDLIKNKITVETPRGADEKARDLIAHLESIGVDFEQAESVNANTLKAFVKEQIKKDVDIPKDVFGIFELNRAKAKDAKGTAIKSQMKKK